MPTLKSTLQHHAGTLRAAGAECAVARRYRAPGPQARTFEVDLTLVANNRSIAVVKLRWPHEPPSWRRVECYTSLGLPVFAVPPAAVPRFAAAWVARDLPALRTWLVGTGTSTKAAF